MPSYNVATSNRFAFEDSDNESKKPKAAPVKKEEPKAAAPAPVATKPAGDRPPRDEASRGRGRGRGGRGGFSTGAPATEEQGREDNRRRDDRPRRGRGGPRMHDREDRTGVNNRDIKKEGGGGHNWGNQAEDFGAEGGDRYAEGERPRRGRGGFRGGRGRGGRFQGEKKEGEKEEKKEETTEEKPAEETAEKTEATEEKKEEKEEEKGPEMLDFAAFKAAQAAKRANLPTIAAKAEVKDITKELKGYSKHEKADQNEKIFISTKHVKGTAHEGKDEESSEEEKTDKKKTMNFFEFAQETTGKVGNLLPREERRRDDRRGGRGGRRSDRPARGPKVPAPHLEDNAAFLTLGGK